MSLINDALKKAQKLQSLGQSPPPPSPGGAPGAPHQPASSGRDRPLPGQIFMLLAFGAGVLIAVSVLATVYLLRHPAAPAVAQAPAALSPTGAAATGIPEKLAFAPVIKAPSQPVSPPALAQNPAPAPAPTLEKFPAATSPATTPAVTSTPGLATTPATAFPPAVSPVLPPPAAIMPPPSAPPAPNLPAVSQPALSLPNGSNSSSGLDPSKPDPKILAYLDALQIAGVRVSDTGSKVLMNDRVFRQNDIVDHLLGLRLKKIETDALTFVDERGVIYTKNL